MKSPPGVRRIVGAAPTRGYAPRTTLGVREPAQQGQAPPAPEEHRAHRFPPPGRLAVPSRRATSVPKGAVAPVSPLIELSVLIGIICIGVGFFSRGQGPDGPHGARARVLVLRRPRRPGHRRPASTSPATARNTLVLAGFPGRWAAGRSLSALAGVPERRGSRSCWSACSWPRFVALRGRLGKEPTASGRLFLPPRCSDEKAHATARVCHHVDGDLRRPRADDRVSYREQARAWRSSMTAPVRRRSRRPPRVVRLR